MARRHFIVLIGFGKTGEWTGHTLSLQRFWKSRLISFKQEKGRREGHKVLRDELLRNRGKIPLIEKRFQGRSWRFIYCDKALNVHVSCENLSQWASP